MIIRRFSVYSKNILTESQLVSGYIRIKGEYIKDILDERILSIDHINIKLQKYPKLYDYESQVIMAGAIDTNIALSPGKDQWDFTQQITALSVLGGTTTIINKPYIYSQDLESEKFDFSQHEMYTKQVEHLQQNCVNDFIQMTYISDDNLDKVQDIKDLGCFCFYTSLSKPLQSQVSYQYDRKFGRIKDATALSRAIQNLSVNQQSNSLFIHMQHNVDKDLGITSPFRSSCIDDRRDLSKECQVVDADGIQGIYSSDDDDLEQGNQYINRISPNGSPVAKLIYSKEITNSPQKTPDKQFSLIVQEISVESLKSPDINEKRFRNQSRNVTKSIQYKLISRAEMLTYDNDTILEPKLEKISPKKNAGEMPLIPEELTNLKLCVCDEDGGDTELVKTSINPWDEDNEQIQFLRKKDKSQSNYQHPDHQISIFSSQSPIKCQDAISLSIIVIDHKINQIQSEEQTLTLLNNSSGTSESSPQQRPRSLSSSTLLARRSRGSSIQVQSFQLTLHHVYLPLYFFIKVPSKKSDEEIPLQTNATNKFSRDYLCFLAFRPSTWEIFSVQMLQKAFKLIHTHQNSLEDSNLSSSNSIENLNIILQGFSSSHTLAKIVELRKKLTPHIFTDLSYPYLFFDSEDIKDGQTIFKADPPIRSKNNKHLLQTVISQPEWIQSVSSSHFYVNPTFKFLETGNLRRAFSGLCSVGLQFQVIWTVLWSNTKLKIKLSNQEIERTFQSPEDTPFKRIIVKKLSQLQDLLSTGPQLMLNLKKKGQLKKGYYADLVVWDPFKFINFSLNKIEKCTKDLKIDFDKDLHIFKNQNMLGSVNNVFIRGNIILEQINTPEYTQQINYFTPKLINRDNR